MERPGLIASCQSVVSKDGRDYVKLSGTVAAMPGETWHFQAWHRDRNPLPTTNYTDAVSITFSN